MNQQQTPQQEMAERAAESLPALQAAAAAVGLQDHQRMLRDHAKRVRDSHRAGAQAAGFSDMAADRGGAGDDPMGDIIISGDITNTYLPPTETAMSNTASNAGGLSHLAKAAVIGASLLSGGVGATIPLVTNLLVNKPAPQTPPPEPPKQHGYEIRLVPDKGDKPEGLGF